MSMDTRVLVKNVNICCWNINGVQNKYLAQDVIELFDNMDLIVIMETKFNIRTKCPDGFFLVARSRTSETVNSTRGGSRCLQEKEL